MGLIKEAIASGNPAEFLALLKYKRKDSIVRQTMTRTLDDDWKYAYTALCNVSRSFALVIMELRPLLRHPICVFYLVLRALDTIEDDTSVDSSTRRQLCIQFWSFLHQSPHISHNSPETTPSSSPPSSSAPTSSTSPSSSAPWSSDQFGTGHEKDLCRNFPIILRCFQSLDPSFQRIIADITRRMGRGMADHIYQVSCDSTADYDLYCHYVAGLVGIGLSQIFATSACEHPSVAEKTHLSNSMGLFLQKTNIIRDYLEDINDGRTFWPSEIWSQYGNDLADFRDPANRKFSLAVLNHMITDALRHVPHVIEYMSHIHSQDVFNFVAIPQVMAVATLAECYNNGNVFERVVKIRRSKTAQLVLTTRNMDAVYKVFFQYARTMLQKLEPHDPNAEATRELLTRTIDVCLPHVPMAPNLIIPNLISIVLFCFLSNYALKRRQEHFDGAVFTWRSAGGIMELQDMLAIGTLFLVCVYMFGFFLLPYMQKVQREEVRRTQNVARAPREAAPQVVTLE